MNLEHINQKIYEIRGQKVMLDYDLAELYEVETKYLNLSVKRNLSRFPIDFMVQLTTEEWNSLRLQIATSKKRGGSRYLPYAFTEQGLAMLSGILNSEKSIQVNIAIMRTFAIIRQYALTHTDLSSKLKLLETKYDKQFDDIFEAINYLLKKDTQEKQVKNRDEIGYKQ
jgi:hypothetical protein